MEGRVEKITDFDHTGNVLYLMQRDFRIQDNYSLILASNLSSTSKTKLYIGTNFKKIKMNENQKAFLFEGLLEMVEECVKLNIPFYIIENIEDFAKEKGIDYIITEFSPLREYISYQNEIKEFCGANSISFSICDSHNIVPCKNVNVYVKSPRGVRIRLYKYWDKYFKDFEKIDIHTYNDKIEVASTAYIDEYKKSSKRKKVNDFGTFKSSFYTINEYDTSNLINKTNFSGGYNAGMKELERFLKTKISSYKKLRNDPGKDFLSNLSPWIHFGQLGTQRIILQAMKHVKSNDENLECFISEIFVWKETAEHFCYHEKNYDNIDGALPWAKETLKKHSVDSRDKIYTLEQLEKGLTIDDEWNSGQKEMVIDGKMHGYVRMYWAKKLMYWTNTPEKALETAIYLNDKHSIDGNDPNGYLGMMWSICGSMDQGWGEREVMGKIRSMKGIKSSEYVLKWKSKKI